MNVDGRDGCEKWVRSAERNAIQYHTSINTSEDVGVMKNLRQRI